MKTTILFVIFLSSCGQPLSNEVGVFADNREELRKLIAGMDVPKKIKINFQDLSFLYKDVFENTDSRFERIDLTEWDVSDVTNMSHMFDGAEFFDQDIGGWDVSNVTNMSYMLYRASSFDQNIDSWEVSEEVLKDRIFEFSRMSHLPPWYQYYVFTVDDLRKYLSQDKIPTKLKIYIQSLSNIYEDVIKNIDPEFKKIVVSDWDVSNVTYMDSTFSGATAFNQPLEGWDVSNVKSMNYTFSGATSFDQPLEKWDVSNVTDMGAMFFGATAFNQPLEGWDVSNVKSMNYTFNGATSFDQPLDDWDTSSVLDMYGMFIDSGLSNLPSWYVTE